MLECPDDHSKTGLHFYRAVPNIFPNFILSQGSPNFYSVPTNCFIGFTILKVFSRAFTYSLFTGADELEEDALMELEERAVNDCLTKSGRMPPTDAVYETPSEYAPLSVNMGQMTVYRYSLRCVCNQELLRPDQKCAKFLPFHRQRWSAFMGRSGDARFDASKESIGGNGKGT